MRHYIIKHVESGRWLKEGQLRLIPEIPLSQDEEVEDV